MFFCRQNFDKTGKKCRLWALIGKVLTKKLLCFGELPLKVKIYIGAKGALRKNLRLVGLKWMSLYFRKEDNLVDAGAEYLRERGRLRESPPKTTPPPPLKNFNF